ncbi:aldo/keto reductase [Acidianus brierleyi]|uniref:Aldo/keto reductase n=1 Tax=Acidianus brierleyi TaxID=41673 RepID=A0A2U9IH21_9CREN|nr:aldo/keto reductase [Acidianus brierleyi]AWR95224.1 aldo/keto reductase [Acidianus brierleyi]
MEFGWTKEKIFPLILGSWEFGTKTMVTREDSKKIIKEAINLGINAIDTAETYGNGESERILGEIIKEIRREDIFIITKVSENHLRYNDVLRAAEGSLRRLNVNYIDLYLVHWPNSYVPIRETAKALEKLYEEGKVRYVGLSNFSLPLMKEFREYLSKTDVAANELHYNLLFRDVEKEIYPYMKKENIPLLAYDSLGLGYLIGRKEVRDEFRWYYLARQEYISSLEPLLGELERISKETGKTLAQIVLNWLLNKENVFPIFNTSKINHLKENIESIGWKLEENILKEIDDAISKVNIDYFIT